MWHWYALPVPHDRKTSTPDSKLQSRTPVGELTFEQALDELESIIQRIEGGEIGLEKSLTEYERGVELLRRCREVLQRAEQRVDELSRSALADAAPPLSPGAPAGPSTGAATGRTSTQR